MSAPKGIRLWLRPARAGHKSFWIILDGTGQKSTGCGPREIERAQQALAAYIAAKHKPERAGGRDLASIPVADVIAIYADEVAVTKARPKPADARLRKLLEFFGLHMLSEVNRRLCRAYAVQRGSLQAARRELEDLRAAINHYFAEESVQPVVNIELPDKAPPRERWLTVQEAAALVRTAWRKTQPMPKGGTRQVGQHVARFILVGLYTGTRSAAICGAAIRPTIGRGYVDLANGVFYRRPPGTKETTKRQPSIRLPDKLLVHMRRWERLGLCEHSVVEWEGRPVKRVSKAFKRIADEAGLAGVTPHTLRHTAITWAMQRGAKVWDASAYFGVSERILTTVYGHHSPDHQVGVTTKMDRRRKA